MYQKIKTFAFTFVCAGAVASAGLFALSAMPSAQASDEITTDRKMDKSLDWHGWPHEEPPEPAEEIAEYRDMRLRQHYEKHGNPQPEDAIRIDSLSELVEYAKKDGVHVKMEPGTYEITVDNFADFISYHTGPRGQRRAAMLHFSGSNSYYDLRGVKITAETKIRGVYPGIVDIDDNRPPMEEIYITGTDIIIRGLDYENVKSEDWHPKDAPGSSMRTLNIEGARNLIQDVSRTTCRGPSIADRGWRSNAVGTPPASKKRSQSGRSRSRTATCRRS